MANKYRNETVLKLGARSYLLRPSFECMAHIETETGKGIYGVMQDLGSPGKCSVSMMAKIVRAGIVGSGVAEKDAPSLQDIGSELQRGGFTNFLPPLFEFLKKAISSDEELEKEARPAEESATGEA